jgi:hypothetical protein
MPDQGRPWQEMRACELDDMATRIPNTIQIFLCDKKRQSSRPAMLKYYPPKLQIKRNLSSVDEKRCSPDAGKPCVTTRSFPRESVNLWKLRFCRKAKDLVRSSFKARIISGWHARWRFNAAALSIRRT